MSIQGFWICVVDGTAVPNEYTISWQGKGKDATPRLHSRRDGTQQEMTVWRDGRLTTFAVPESTRDRPVLTESQALTVARLVKDIENTLGFPADVEWAFDEEDTSILAREYGLPAVVNVQGATQKLHEGDRVELNGSTGTICVLEQALDENKKFYLIRIWVIIKQWPHGAESFYLPEAL